MGTVTSKRALYTVSRAIEQYAGALVGSGQDVLLVGLFQEAVYYDSSRHVYEELAASGADLAVGFTGSAELSRGVPVVALPEGHELAEEWTVLLASRRVCAALVAQDLHTIGMGRSAEDARQFAATITTDTERVRGEMRRVLAAAEELVDESVRARLSQWAGRAGEVSDPVDAASGVHLQRAWTEVTERIARLQEVERAAMTDPLTGAMNRRYLDAYLHHLGPRSPAITATAFDFDDFKQLNDTFGHAVGDEALRTFADVVRSHVRDTDVLVRLGGDEWLLLQPDVELTVAVQRIRQIIEDVHGRELSAEGAYVRTSAGVGRFAATQLDIEQIDEALYRAKETTDRIHVLREA